MAVDGTDTFIKDFLYPSVTERIVADVAQHDASINSRHEVLERLGFRGRQTVAGSNYMRFGLLVRLGVLIERPATEDTPRLTYSVDPSAAEEIASYYELKIEAMRGLVEALKNTQEPL